MDKKVQRILDKINEGDPTWKDDFIADWDCIKRLDDLKAIELLLSPVNPGTQSGAILLSPELTTPLLGGEVFGYDITSYGVGTAYSLTNTQAAINLGTTDPVIVVDVPGTYLIQAQAHLSRAGATVVAETASIKVRRTNNTPADLSPAPVIDLPVSTTLTDTLGLFVIPPFIYRTANINDALSIFGAVSAALGAGTIDVTALGTSIVAVRLSDATI